MSLAITNTGSTGYEDIDRLNNNANNLYEKAYEQQQNMINKQTELNIDEIERNKQKLNEETTKEASGLYRDYQKQVNPYGATAESLATNGLANSGVAESTKTNLYNNYQTNRTNVMNNAKTLLADYNSQISQARATGDMQLAQAALDLYNQQIDNLYNIYNLTYQKKRDEVSDSQWQKEFDNSNYWNQLNYDYQKGRDAVADSQWQQQYDYQVNRDAVADSQWQKEYELSKKALSSSRSSASSKTSRKSSSSSKSSSNTKLDTNDNEADELGKQIMQNISYVQGPGVSKPIKDNTTGKRYATLDDLFLAYGLYYEG